MTSPDYRHWHARISAILHAEMDDKPHIYRFVDNRELDARIADMASAIASEIAAPRKQTSKEILDAVAAEYGFTVDDITGPRGDYELIQARREAINRMRRLGLSFVSIGRRMNRPRQTVSRLYNLQKAAQAEEEGKYERG
ncbi:hypothetical protein [Roseicella sp. DB1501]|uniref:hypothetical protein n=1 Tax=Roseicella sp. DB1501 TaxID=2730925 RepID=UPI001492DF3C|nr:hypothetical protein [Roseicella sp. DB1501]NOG70467.1 hypothetical protein [Roseicella sp. DB1501]